MIYTITFNPSIDYIVHMDSMTFGITNRSKTEEFYLGGKGINVSWVLKELGKPSVAMGFVAGFTGKAIEDGVKNHGIKTNFIHLPYGNSRINIKIKSGEETEINAQGPDIPDDAVRKLFDALTQIKDGDTLILAGSIPNSLPTDIYERILKEISSKKIRCVVDASKDLLLNVLKYRPFLIKPNKQELGDLFSVNINSYNDVIKYGRKLSDMGAENVLISLGEKGSVLIDEYGEIHKMGIVDCTAINTVGSGDSMVAGFVAGYIETSDYDYALKLGTACGSATASLPGLAEKERIKEMLERI